MGREERWLEGGGKEAGKEVGRSGRRGGVDEEGGEVERMTTDGKTRRRVTWTVRIDGDKYIRQDCRFQVFIVCSDKHAMSRSWGAG